MTQEQIKQNARTYAHKEYMLCSGGEKEAAIKDFIAGAHSRDEEVERLASQVIELNTDNVRIMCERDSLRSESRIEIESLRNEIEKLKAELAEAKNPWRDAQTNPPKDDEDVFVLTPYGTHGCGTYEENGKWYVAGFGIIEVSWWMPFPPLKGGNV